MALSSMRNSGMKDGERVQGTKRDDDDDDETQRNQLSFLC